MPRHCVICNKAIEEEHGKLEGTIVKAIDENRKTQFIHVCSGCQKQDDWIERAKIKGA